MLYFKKSFLYALSAFFMLLALSTAPVKHAFSATEAAAVETPEMKPDKHNRRTPRGTVEGFIAAMSEEDYERAIEYLKTDNISQNKNNKIELAQKFQYLLDHAGKLQASVLISEYTEGQSEDGFDLNLDQVGNITIDNETVPVLVEQVLDSDELPIWLFSEKTLEKIPRTIKKDVKLFNIANYVPEQLNNTKFISVSASHWLAIFLVMILSFFIAWITVKLIMSLINMFCADVISEHKYRIITALSIPTRVWLAVYIFISSLQYLSIPIIMRQHFNSIAIAVYLFAFLVVLWQITNLLYLIAIDKFNKTNHLEAISIVDFLRRSIKFILAITAILVGMHLYDHNVTTGLAALGIGGLAIALGAQKTLENIAGSVNVVADQYVRIGDFIKVDDVMGTIEEVGVRSTKIRTLARTIVTIPNAEFSIHKIENFSKRDKFFLDYEIGIRYETSPDQMRFLLINLRKMLHKHPKVYQEPLYVKFKDFGADSLIIKIFGYVNANCNFEFLDIKEDINLRIIDIVNQSGTGFAFPSQTLYLSKDHGLSKDLCYEAEQTVKEWRNNNDLAMPDFTQESKDKLSNSLSYPEFGSVLANELIDKN